MPTRSPYDVLSVATGAPACASAYILWKDSFTVPMVVDLLSKRFHNYVAMNPKRGEADELHNADFIDILTRGESILDICSHRRRRKNQRRVEVDLSPIDKHEVVSNPQRYTYPACAITQRFAALMSLADFPLLPDSRMHDRNAHDQLYRPVSGQPRFAGKRLQELRGDLADQT